MEKPYRYHLLVEKLAGRISSGVYVPGEKLPSIRKIHRTTGLSISTVFKAFIALEELGLIEARSRSGYYVRPVKLQQLQPPKHHSKMLPPGEVRLSSVINSVVAAVNDARLLPLGMTVADPRLMPVRHLARILKAIPAAKLQSLLAYALSEGSPALRQQIARTYRDIVENLTADDIIITNGCMEAVALALLALVKPGDTVAIETPTNYSFLQLLNELGVNVVEVPTAPATGLDVDMLERILSHTPVKACLLMPNFHNPTGALMPDAAKTHLVALLNRHNVPVVEDDVSAELYFNEPRPHPLKAFDQQDNVISCSSFSKTLAPGLRIGWVIPGKRFMEKIRKLKASLTVSTSALDQYLLAEYLAGGYYERHLRQLRSKLHHQVIRTALAIQRHFPPETRFMTPGGGSLLWIELPRSIDSLVLHQKALKKNIAIIPGVTCSNSGQFVNYIQISCASPLDDKMVAGIAALGRMMCEDNKYN